jgi:hypothetical protein
MYKNIESVHEYEPLRLELSDTSITLVGTYNNQNIYIDFPRIKPMNWAEEQLVLDNDIYEGRLEFAVWLDYENRISKLEYNLDMNKYAIYIPFEFGLYILLYGHGLYKNMGLPFSY